MLLVEGAYFVGRKEIVDWVNKTCSLSLTKVEETASGAPACMLLDQIFPGQVPLQKVNWNAKQSFEFVGNYKILQDSFTRLKVDRHIDVDRLKEGKYMDNLEFMQWFKRFYEISTGSGERSEEYNAVEARCRGKGGKTFVGTKKTHGAPVRVTSAPGQDARVAARKKAEEEGRKLARSKSAAASDEAPTRGGRGPVANAKAPAAAAPGSPDAGVRMSSNAAIVANKALVAEVQTLKTEKAEMKGDMVGLEKERDFYFDKLRDIEILLQDMEEEGLFRGSGDIGNEISSKVFKILYATADGFVQSPSAQSQQSVKSNNNGNIGISAAATAAITSPMMSAGVGQSHSIVGDDEEDSPISPVKYPVSASIEIDAGEDNDDDSTGAGVPAPPDEEDAEDGM